MNQVQLAHEFRSGNLPVTNYVSQIESFFEKREPAVLAFTPEENRFERLRREAAALVSNFPDPARRPPLFGMLTGVKDIIHVNGFITQAGSRLPSRELQGNEAESVTRLRNAGALIMGKTVTTEFAYFLPGPTRNPYNPEHTPGGSSSGSAAAVGAGLCPLALGTQTIGSLLRPAAFCGVVGFKPTYERVSRDGIIDLSTSFDHIGFFTPDAGTAKKVASVVIGRSAWRLETDDRKPVLGIPEGAYLNCASDYALTCFNAICDSLAEAGYELRRVRVMDNYEEVRARHDVIMSADAARVHEKWFEKYETLYSSKLTELIRRGQPALRKARGGVSSPQLQIAFEARDKFRAEIMQIMSDSRIDLWVAPPAHGPAPRGLDNTGDPVMNLPWTQIGFPAINLPAGKNQEGLPMGFQVIGKWNMDEELLAWAEDLEKVVNNL